MTDPQLADIERRANVAGSISGKQALRLIEYLREIKEENKRLRDYLGGLYPDVIHLPDCDVLNKFTGATCSCKGQGVVDALLDICTPFGA